MKGLSLGQCLEWDFKGFINKLLRIPRDKIEREVNLAGFGFNSLSLTQLAIQLVKYYGIPITPALFFGYSTIAKLAQYYLIRTSRSHSGVLPGRCGAAGRRAEVRRSIDYIHAANIPEEPDLQRGPRFKELEHSGADRHHRHEWKVSGRP